MTSAVGRPGLIFLCVVGTLLIEVAESTPVRKLDVTGSSDRVVWATVIGLVIVWELYISGMFRWYI
jgi:hypothetical protein